MREEARAGARRRLTRDERRAGIMEAAARVFADRGYDGATLDEIAEAAGISKPVIYDHFESKKNLHVSLLESHTDELLAFMAARVAEEPATDRQLVAGLAAFLEFVERDPYAWRLIFREPAAADSDIVDAYERIQRRATEAIAGFSAEQPIEERAEDRFDREVVSELIAVMIKAASNGIVAWWYEHRDITRDQLVWIMMNVLWTGLGQFQTGERWTPEEAPRARRSPRAGRTRSA